jgi:hypothetical protein
MEPAVNSNSSASAQARSRATHSLRWTQALQILSNSTERLAGHTLLRCSSANTEPEILECQQAASPMPPLRPVFARLDRLQQTLRSQLQQFPLCTSRACPVSVASKVSRWLCEDYHQKSHLRAFPTSCREHVRAHVALEHSKYAKMVIDHDERRTHPVNRVRLMPVATRC